MLACIPRSPLLAKWGKRAGTPACFPILRGYIQIQQYAFDQTLYRIRENIRAFARFSPIFRNFRKRKRKHKMFNRNGSQTQNNSVQPNGHKPEESTALIRLRGVQKSYYTAAGEFPALKGIDLNIHAARRKELVLRNVRRQNRCLRAALDLIAEKKVNVDPLATHHFPLAQVQQAFDLVADYRGGVIKAMIHVTD